MSHEEAKVQRSTRIHDKETKIKKEVRLAKEYGIPVKEPHKLHKKHVMNCGNPKCFMCANPRKVFKEDTLKEKSFAETQKWIEE